MTRNEAINELKCAIDLIKQDGKDWLDERDIPLLQMAIEALERKHGEWNETSESIGWEEVGCAECSVCGKTLVLGDYTMDDIKNDYNYCPNCGSDMRGDEDEC